MLSGGEINKFAHYLKHCEIDQRLTDEAAEIVRPVSLILPAP